MKRPILFLSLIMASLSSAQIQKVETVKCIPIGAIKPMGMLQIENEKCGDDTYRFTYRDMKFSKITDYKSFEFKDIDNAYNSLFDVINKGFETPPKDDITLKLPNDLLTLKFEKSLGISVVTIYHTNQAGTTGVFQSFGKKQFYKLFGKKG